MAKKKSFPIQPLGDRVIVKRLEESADKTAGGILLPESAKEKPQIAEVVAVGPGKVGDDNKRVPVEVKIGDRIFHARYGGTEVKYDGDDYTILKEEDILAVVVA
jgi:chaperonin GroES